MNAVTLQGLSGVADAGLAARLSQLDPATRREVLSRAVEWGVMQGLAEARAAGGLGQAPPPQDAISAAVARVLAPMMPALQQQLVAAAEPAARKAADVVGPVVEQKLKEYGPTFGIIAGLVSAILGVLGMVAIGSYVVRRVA